MNKSSVIIKSNVSLKRRELVRPMDNMPKQYFDVRVDSALTPEQKIQKEKMLFWANKIVDENGNPVEWQCYKGCLDCGEPKNHCKRPLNLNKIKKRFLL
jgi:hypothetical protein